MVLIEGAAEVGADADAGVIRLSERDALEITEQPIQIRALADSHLFLIEMAKP
jgi:hypothetical protein